MSDMPEEYEAQSDLDTLTRANEIMANPGRVARAKRFAQDQRDRMEEAAKRLGGGTRVTTAVQGSGMQPKG